MAAESSMPSGLSATGATAAVSAAQQQHENSSSMCNQSRIKVETAVAVSAAQQHMHTFRRKLLNCEGAIRQVIADATTGVAPLNIVFHCKSGKNRSPVGLAAALVVAAVVQF